VAKLTLACVSVRLSW